MFGNMIGVGIFLYPSIIANVLRVPSLFILVWIWGGVVASMGALSSAELAIMKTETGGDYAYLRNAYGQKLAFQYGFLCSLITFPGSIAIGLNLGFHYQGKSIFGDWVDSKLLNIALFNHDIYAYQIISIGFILLLYYINTKGLRFSLIIQKFATLFPILFLLFVFSCLLLMMILSDKSLYLIENLSYTQMGDFSVFHMGTALVAVYWTFSGWNAPLVFGGELENSRRVIPRVMIFGPIAVTCIYIFFCILFLSLMPFDVLKNPNKDIYQIIVNQFLHQFHLYAYPNLLSLLILMIVVGNVNSALLTGSRIILAMSNDKLYFESFSKLDPETQTPKNSIRLIVIFSILIILTLNKESDILKFSSIPLILLSILTIFSIFIQRKKFKHFVLIKYLSFPIAPILYILNTSFIVFILIYEYYTSGEFLIPIMVLSFFIFGYLISLVWEKIIVKT
jgi:APA family basic amino acid/polyamine antiporter